MIQLTDTTSVIALLDQSNIAVERALLALYARQTDEEQIEGRTVEDNGYGFNGVDSEIFSSFAMQILSSQYPAGRRLSPKQYAICRKVGSNGRMRIGKYAKQLLEIAKAKTKQQSSSTD